MSEINEMTIYEICLLHSRADRALRLVVARELEAHQITMMQWLLLATAASGPTNGTRMTELAESLDVTMPQITALMNDLVKKNLVKQKINAADRRSRRLLVTKQGKELVANATKELDAGVKEWLKAVPDDQLDSYLKTIRQLSDMGQSAA